MLGVRRWRELVMDRNKLEGYCSIVQSPQRAVVPMEEEEEEEEDDEEEGHKMRVLTSSTILSETFLITRRTELDTIKLSEVLLFI